MTALQNNASFMSIVTSKSPILSSIAFLMLLPIQIYTMVEVYHGNINLLEMMAVNLMYNLPVLLVMSALIIISFIIKVVREETYSL